MVFGNRVSGFLLEGGLDLQVAFGGNFKGGDEESPKIFRHARDGGEAARFAHFFHHAMHVEASVFGELHKQRVNFVECLRTEDMRAAISQREERLDARARSGDNAEYTRRRDGGARGVVKAEAA